MLISIAIALLSCYPSRGSEEMAIELARVITANGGTVLINAMVDQILIKRENRDGDSRVHVTGVRMADDAKTVIRAARVVSGAGYARTFLSLIEAGLCEQLQIPRQLSVPQSAGFVMANIGIKATAEEIGASSSNFWHIPLDGDNDIFGPMRKYFSNPMGVGMDMPAFITFPSCKDKKWEADHPGRLSCQMLFMADYNWFEAYRGDSRKSDRSEHQELYSGLKRAWENKALDVFYKYFPKV